MKKHKLLNVQLLLLTVLMLFALTSCKKQNDTEEVANTPNNLSDLISEDEPTQTVVVDLPIAESVTGEEIDSSESLGAIIKESYEKAKSMLEENRDVLDKIADHLYENENITGEEFMRIFRELKGIPEPEKENAQTEEEKIENSEE